MAPDLHSEAAEWFVRLNMREPDTDEVGDWQRWLLKSDAHRQAFSEFEDLWLTIGQTEHRPSTTPAADQVRRNTRWRWAAALAATVLFGAVGAFFLTSDAFKSNDLPSSAAVQTRTAQNRTYALPDGSRIEVGASTRVVVDFGSSTRSVIIDSGEAYFEVAHDTQRPFVVHAGGGTITAVGTAFNVHSALGRVSVAVVEGAVDVRSSAKEAPSIPSRGKAAGTDPARPLLVHAGEGVAYDRATHTIESVDPRVATSWRDGHLKFLREPLAYVVSDIERYADLHITIADPAVGELRYTGTVIPKDVDDWLTLVSQAFPIEVQRINKHAVLLRRAPTAPPPEPAGLSAPL